MAAKIIIPQELLRAKYESGLKQAEIAAEFGVSEMKIYRAMKEYGIAATHRYRHHQYDESFFSTWSSDMAYILGFITCDGYIHTRRKTEKSLRIDIQAADVEILEYIKSKMCPTMPIRFRNRFNKKTGNTHRQAHLRVQSKQIVADLAKLGVSERKTGNEYMPDMPEEFKFDYLRGIIDGDGSICASFVCMSGKSYMRPRMQIVSSSLSFLAQLQHNILGGSGTVSKKPRVNCHTWCNDRRKEIISLLSKMYRNGVVLKRKHDKFTEILNYDTTMLDNQKSAGCSSFGCKVPLV